MSKYFEAFQESTDTPPKAFGVTDLSFSFEYRLHCVGGNFFRADVCNHS